MPNVYRFVGSESIVGSLKLDRFGTRILMEDSVAQNAQLGGAALIAESDFLQIGFTKEDARWFDPYMDPFEIPHLPEDRIAKAAFQEKRSQAQQLFCELRQRLDAERHSATEPGGTLDSADTEINAHIEE
jgi:hypothetical protein